MIILYFSRRGPYTEYTSYYSKKYIVHIIIYYIILVNKFWLKPKTKLRSYRIRLYYVTADVVGNFEIYTKYIIIKLMKHFNFLILRITGKNSNVARAAYIKKENNHICNIISKIENVLKKRLPIDLLV